MSNNTTSASAAANIPEIAYLINIPVGPDTWSDENKLGALLEKVQRIKKVVFKDRTHEIVLGLNQATGRGCNPIKLSDDAKGKIKEAEVKYHEFKWQKPTDKDQPLIRDGKEITVDYCAIRRGMMVNDANKKAYDTLKTTDRVYYVSIDPDTHITEAVLQNFERQQTAKLALLTTGLYTFGKNLENVVGKQEDYTPAKLILAIESEFGYQLKSKLATIPLARGMTIGDLLYPAEPIMFALIKDAGADIGKNLLWGAITAFPANADHSEGQYLGFSLKKSWEESKSSSKPKGYLPENHLGFTYATEAPQRNIDSAVSNSRNLPKNREELIADLSNVEGCAALKAKISASLKFQSQSAFSDNFKDHMITRIDFHVFKGSNDRTYKFTEAERDALKAALNSPATKKDIEKAREDILDAVIVRLKEICKIPLADNGGPAEKAGTGQK